MPKLPFPTDKRHWSPSLIPGPIVLISTVNTEGEPNVAPKSWVQMVAFEPPMLMFSGTRGNPTENNIEATGCFAVNIVNEAVLDSALNCLAWRGRERIERSGWTLVPATTIAAPLVGGCPAHLECELDRTLEVGSGFVVFGRIVAASIDEEIMKGDERDRYRRLASICFLEDGVYAPIRDTIRR